MPFRFRKTLKLGKGLKLNLSKSGISTSIGGRGSLILGGSVLGFCLFCFGATFVMDATGTLTTPTPTLDLIAIQSTAQTGVFQSFTQTAQAMPTLTATSTVPPTSTNTPAPTATSFPTFTAVPTLAVVVPNNPPAAAVCSCSGDSLNCGDFSSHANAQACFNYCVSVGAGDIHGLDGDSNGLACEKLP